MSSPAETLATMAKVTQARILAPWHVQIVQGVLAGCYIALGGLLALIFEAGFNDTVSRPLGMLVGGAVFPMGLIGIAFTGANLFTGNCMFIVPTLMNRDVSAVRISAFLALSWFTNFAGALLVAYGISYGGDWIQKEPVVSWMQAAAEYKVSLSFGAAFSRGVGAGWLVCLGLWQGVAGKDGASKILGVWFPVFAFTAIGFEHSVANMFYITTGMQVGAKVSVFEFLFVSEVPVTLGNFVAGFFLLGFAAWLTHDPRCQKPNDKAGLLPAAEP